MMNRIRRPLCVLFLAYLAFLCIVLYFRPQKEDAFASYDGRRVTLEGRVAGKTPGKSGTDEEGSIWVLDQVKLSGAFAGSGSPGLPYVQVYPADADSEPAVGQTVRINGVLRVFSQGTNPGSFDSRRYYAVQGMAFRVYEAEVLSVEGNAHVFRETLYRLRIRCGRALDTALPAEDAGVLKAMLLGDRSALDRELTDRYRATGIAHLLSISGLHIGIMGGCLYRLLGRLRVPAKGCVALCVPLMYAYGVLCGMPTSAYRAIVMFLLSLLAKLAGRTYDMLSALSLIGILMLAEQPLYARDGGFLLSFGCVAGLGMLFPGLKQIAEPLLERCPKRLQAPAELVLASVSVTLFTLPVQLCMYGTFPVFSALWNLLVIPVTGVLMPAGMLVLTAQGAALLLPGSAGVVMGLLAHLPALAVQAILRFYHGICDVALHLPFHTLYAGHPGVARILLYYALLAAFVLLTGKKDSPVCGARQRKAESASLFSFLRRIRGGRQGNTRRKPVYSFRCRIRRGRQGDTGRMSYFPLLPLFAAVLLLTLRPVPAFRITFLDVGQGDCAVIRCGRHTYLADCGSSSVSEVGRYRLLPYLRHEGIGSVDAIFLSHEDADHINGIAELLTDMEKGGIRVKSLFLPDAEGEAGKDDFRELVLSAQRMGIPVVNLSAGQVLLQGDLVFTCLAPAASGGASGKTDAEETVSSKGTANEHSMVLHLMYRPGFSVLLTGDIEGEGLRELNGMLATLPASMRNVDVLKVAHHGSRNTTDEPFLSLTDARLSVISCGKNNRYGHPHREVLDRLEADGSQILTTPACGAITVTVSHGGRKATVSEFLPPQDSAPHLP